MKSLTSLLVWTLLVLVLVACSPQTQIVSTQKIWIDAPVEFAALTEGIHNVTVHASYTGEIDLFRIIFRSQGPYDSYAYSRAAVAPGEPLDSYHIVNFEWVIPGRARAVVPFPFIPFPFMTNDDPIEYTLTACIVGAPENPGEIPPPIDCAEIVVYMPNCGSDEVSLGPDCIPAAVDESTPDVQDDFVAIPDRNVNCRLGPSASLFEIDDTLIQGSEYKPLAQGPDAFWLLFQGPITGNRCWAFADYLELTCNAQIVELADISPCTLEVAAYPSLPTLTPTPTFTAESEVTSTPVP